MVPPDLQVRSDSKLNIKKKTFSFPERSQQHPYKDTISKFNAKESRQKSLCVKRGRSEKVSCDLPRKIFKVTSYINNKSG